MRISSSAPPQGCHLRLCFCEDLFVQARLKGGHPNQVQPQGDHFPQAQYQEGHLRQVQGSFLDQLKVQEGLHHQVQVKAGILQAQFL